MPEYKSIEQIPRDAQGRIPSWLRRAIKPNNPTTKQNETVRTASADLDGQEILYPTIRLVNGRLRRLGDDEAFETAVRNSDYIVADSPSQATDISRAISRFIQRQRGGKTRTPASQRLERKAKGD
jgi:hypothetical protein